MSSKSSTSLGHSTITKMAKSRSKLARLRQSNKKTEGPETNKLTTSPTKVSLRTYSLTALTKIKKKLSDRLLRGKSTLKPRSREKAKDRKCWLNKSAPIKRLLSCFSKKFLARSRPGIQLKESRLAPWATKFGLSRARLLRGLTDSTKEQLAPWLLPMKRARLNGSTGLWMTRSKTWCSLRRATASFVLERSGIEMWQPLRPWRSAKLTPTRMLWCSRESGVKKRRLSLRIDTWATTRLAIRWVLLTTSMQRAAWITSSSLISAKNRA